MEKDKKLSKQNRLEIPPAVMADVDAFEILSVWAANNEQQISLRSRVWEDPAAWGIMLADLARHIAECYCREDKIEFGSALERIKAGIDVELG